MQGFSDILQSVRIFRDLCHDLEKNVTHLEDIRKIQEVTCQFKGKESYTLLETLFCHFSQVLVLLTID
jgi:hypothetical protein